MGQLKFMRGNLKEYKKLFKENRIDPDTLYFIYENENSVTARMFLGKRLITNNVEDVFTIFEGEN